MHEYGITESVVTAVTERLPDATISCVHLEIGSLSGVSVFNPSATFLPFGIPSLSQFPTNVKIDTASVYALDSVAVSGRPLRATVSALRG